MIEIVDELKSVMREKKISPETAGLFVGVSGKQIRRWLEEKAVPNLNSRRALRRGLKRIKKIL